MAIAELFLGLHNHRAVADFSEVERDELDAIALLFSLNFDETGDQIREILERRYSDGISGFEGVKVEESRIVGVFYDIVSPSLTKKFNFSINGDTGEVDYTQIDTGKDLDASFSEYSFATKGKSKQCKEGKSSSCTRADGSNYCIKLGYKCKSVYLSPQERAAVAAITQKNKGESVSVPNPSSDKPPEGKMAKTMREAQEHKDRVDKMMSDYRRQKDEEYETQTRPEKLVRAELNNKTLSSGESISSAKSKKETLEEYKKLFDDLQQVERPFYEIEKADNAVLKVFDSKTNTTRSQEIKDILDKDTEFKSKGFGVNSLNRINGQKRKELTKESQNIKSRQKDIDDWLNKGAPDFVNKIGGRSAIDRNFQAIPPSPQAMQNVYEMLQERKAELDKGKADKKRSLPPKASRKVNQQ